MSERHRKERAVWSNDEVIEALNVCEDLALRIYLYLALEYSLRLGEVLGLQWSNIHIDGPHAAAGERK